MHAVNFLESLFEKKIGFTVSIAPTLPISDFLSIFYWKNYPTARSLDHNALHTSKSYVLAIRLAGAHRAVSKNEREKKLLPFRA